MYANVQKEVDTGMERKINDPRKQNAIVGVKHMDMPLLCLELSAVVKLERIQSEEVQQSFFVMLMLMT